MGYRVLRKGRVVTQVRREKVIGVIKQLKPKASAQGRSMDDEIQHEYRKLGVIFNPTDVTGPAELQHVVSRLPGVIAQSVNCRFPPGVESLSKDTFEFALSHLTDTVDALQPVGSFQSIGVSCTSFSFAVGMDRINKAIQSAHPNTTVTNMADCLFHAARTMGMRRILVLTPYTDDLNAILKGVLEREGFAVLDFVGFGISTDFDIFKCPRSRIRCGVKDLQARNANVGNQADGIVISCSALRVVEEGFIDSLEQETGLPIVTSMQSFLWNMLRLAGDHRHLAGFGSLFQKH